MFLAAFRNQQSSKSQKARRNNIIPVVQLRIDRIFSHNVLCCLSPNSHCFPESVRYMGIIEANLVSVNTSSQQSCYCTKFATCILVSRVEPPLSDSGVCMRAHGKDPVWNVRLESWLECGKTGFEVSLNVEWSQGMEV